MKQSKLKIQNKEQTASASYSPLLRGGVSRDSGEGVGLYFLFNYATIRRISPI